MIYRSEYGTPKLSGGLSFEIVFFNINLNRGYTEFQVEKYVRFDVIVIIKPKAKKYR